MSIDTPQDGSILLRCPSCGARFGVNEDMRGHMTTCGECEHRFEIADPVILKGRKFYPGEKRDPLLSQVNKVHQALPRADAKNAPADFASQSVPVYIEPASPQRILMRVLALFAIGVTALFLILGAKRGGALEGVSMESRMTLAGFVSIMATGLLVFSNVRSWLLMILAGLLMGCGLVSLPLFFTGGADSLEADARRIPADRADKPSVSRPVYSIPQMRR